jgi:hypothetical protein
MGKWCWFNATKSLSLQAIVVSPLHVFQVISHGVNTSFIVAFKFWFWPFLALLGQVKLT